MAVCLGTVVVQSDLLALLALLTLLNQVQQFLYLYSLQGKNNNNSFFSCSRVGGINWEKPHAQFVSVPWISDRLAMENLSVRMELKWPIFRNLHKDVFSQSCRILETSVVLLNLDWQSFWGVHKKSAAVIQAIGNECMNEFSESLWIRKAWILAIFLIWKKTVFVINECEI